MSSCGWPNDTDADKIPAMHASDWLNTEDRFTPGAELFRSDRAFTTWAYTISHSQLLLRTRTTTQAGSRQSRIDIVFKPVRAMKIRIEYDGLVIRCATLAEAEKIRADNTGIHEGAHCLLLETGGDLDYVIAHAVGWEEDMETDRDPSRLAGFAPGSDPGRILK
ncbi:hypothetical protein [Actinomadura rudentiformis]|uniref:Uncharacterized protein n=1 Tax=Actinomadura rudentiformis TaxID=359158 RepID=A0A6H9ZCE2_9ACTN|nr:hypothetical protein [Actinomadura rudentiformis]KAB2352219.1 hypothetical protein F8566_00440 [Actinomadura rudentiformis]